MLPSSKALTFCAIFVFGFSISLTSLLAAEKKKNQDEEPADITFPEIKSEDILKIALAPGEAQKRNVDLFRRKLQRDNEANGKWESLTTSEKINALAQIQLYGPVQMRRAAVLALANIGTSDDEEGKGIKSLVRATITDSDQEVRDTALIEIALRQDERTPKLLAKFSKVKDPETLRRTYYAMGPFAGPALREAIVEEWKAFWGPFPRVHMIVAQQRSYIADYDISGDSYDPVIRNVLDGVVLDVKTMWVEATLLIVKMMRHKTQKDVAWKVPEWKKWWLKEKVRRFNELAQRPIEDFEGELLAPNELLNQDQIKKNEKKTKKG